MIRILRKGETAAEHASELVGKFVGKEGIMNFRSYSRPMFVTGYGGNRLYVKLSLVEHRTVAEDDARLLPPDEWEEEAHIQFKSVAYVCDTIEECERMMQAGRRAMRIWQDGIAQIKRDTAEVYAELVTDHDTAATARPRG
jgi:hypothetical protein